MSSRQRKKWPESRNSHLEWRKKVTLADFYWVRLNNHIEIPYGSLANAALYGCPVNRPRAKTKDLVPFSDKTLTRLCKPLTTPVCADFYRKGAPAWQKTPRYVDWLRSIGAGPVKTAPKPRAKRKATPMFTESKPERWRDVPAYPMEAIPCFLR